MFTNVTFTPFAHEQNCGEYHLNQSSHSLDKIWIEGQIDRQTDKVILII